jgi:hypothetical protein
VHVGCCNEVPTCTHTDNLDCVHAMDYGLHQHDIQICTYNFIGFPFLLDVMHIARTARYQARQFPQYVTNGLKGLQILYCLAAELKIEHLPVACPACIVCSYSGTTKPLQPMYDWLLLLHVPAEMGVCVAYT